MRLYASAKFKSGIWLNAIAVWAVSCGHACRRNKLRGAESLVHLVHRRSQGRQLPIFLEQ